MDFIQWIITTIIGILGILIVRSLQRYDRKNEKDKEILDQLVNMLKDEILYCRYTYFGNTFDWDKLMGLREYIVKCEDSGFFFLDKDLENLRKKLLLAINEFVKNLSISSFPVNLNNPTLSRIPQEDEDKIYGENAYENLSRKLDDLSDDVCNIYNEIVKTGRKKV